MNPAETTFVFVTPRVWRDDSRTKWIENRRALGQWADVRLIDGIDLEAWLGEHEAVASRFATQVLRIMPAADVYSADDFWEEYVARARGRLTADVILAGRKEQTDNIRSQLASIPSRIVVIADSRDEALAFVLAASRTSDPEASKYAASRCNHRGK